MCKTKYWFIVTLTVVKKVFVSFASSDLWRSVKRITKQAEALQVFDEIYVCTEKDLDEDFLDVFRDKLKFGTRGFGYWCWKPQIILQTLDKMEEGDTLLYTDVGCHLRAQGKNRLLEYFALAEKHGIVAFQSKPLFNDDLEVKENILFEYKWTKGDVLDYFKVRHNKSITHTGTIGAGILFINKTQAVQEMMGKWLETYKTDFSLLDDSPSQSPNLSGFIEHRHDQSIWSILCKQNHVFTLSAFEYAYPTKEFGVLNWDKIKEYPIWAIRDRDYGFLKNFLRSKYLRSLKIKDVFTVTFYKTVIRFTYAKFFKLINR